MRSHFRLGNINNAECVNILNIVASVETMHNNENGENNRGFETPSMEEVLEENQTADEL